MTLMEFYATHYLAERSLSAGSQKNYRQSINRFSRFLGREAAVHDLSQPVFDAFFDWLLDEGYGHHVIDNTRWLLRALWWHAANHELVDELPPGDSRPVNVPPEPAVDISSVLAIHKAAQEREQQQAAREASAGKSTFSTLAGVLKRLVSQKPKPPTLLPVVDPPAPDRDPATITIAELIAAWRAWAAVEQRAGERGNMNAALRPLEAFYGHELAKDFGPKKLKAVRQLSVDGYTIGERQFKGLSRVHLNARVGRIKRVFKWAVSEELVPAAVYQGLVTVAPLRYGRTTAPERPPVPPVDDSTVDATLPHLPPVVAAMVQFQRLTGCRPGEVCTVRPCDIDTSGEVWVYKPPEHKTLYAGKVRAIYVGPQAQEVLRPYLEGRDPEVYCFAPRESELWRKEKRRAERKTAVQPSQVDRSKPKRRKQPGAVYLRREYSRAVRRTCKDNGIPPWRPNQLRHSVATKVRHAFGLESAQVVLGHSKADTTQIYAERNDALGIEAMRQIG